MTFFIKHPVRICHYLDNTAMAVKTPFVSFFGKPWTGTCTFEFSPKLGPGKTCELPLLGCDISEFYSKLNNHRYQEWRVQLANPCKT